ncbi:RNA polymerase sigma factor [Lentzea sp. NPDC058450]|uniref:RNA polymerase sigma factor n=1 Tax=Lentzea sp. NPDC058450 TaxID=3346505 RepID=UPI0036635872
MLAQELFDQHYLQLVRIAVSVVGDQETAEDVVQDVFAALPGRMDNPRGYLTTAVFNRSRSVLRRRVVALRFRPPAPPPAEGADEHALREYERERVLVAIRSLPHRQREVVVLRYLEDLPPAEVAELLGISKEAVASSLNRALESLRGKLGRS